MRYMIPDSGVTPFDRDRAHELSDGKIQMNLGPDHSHFEWLVPGITPPYLEEFWKSKKMTIVY